MANGSGQPSPIGGGEVGFPERLPAGPTGRGLSNSAALVDLVAKWLRAASAAASAPDALALPTTGDGPAPGAAPGPVPSAAPDVRAAAYVDALLRAFARGALLIG